MMRIGETAYAVVCVLTIGVVATAVRALTYVLALPLVAIGMVVAQRRFRVLDLITRDQPLAGVAKVVEVAGPIFARILRPVEILNDLVSSVTELLVRPFRGSETRRLFFTRMAAEEVWSAQPSELLSHVEQLRGRTLRRVARLVRQLGSDASTSSSEISEISDQGFKLLLMQSYREDTALRGLLQASLKAGPEIRAVVYSSPYNRTLSKRADRVFEQMVEVARAQMPATFDSYDRLWHEGSFRAALALPVSLVVIGISRQVESPWTPWLTSLSLFLIGLFLFVFGYGFQRGSDGVILDAYSAGLIALGDPGRDNVIRQLGIFPRHNEASQDGPILGDYSI